MTATSIREDLTGALHSNPYLRNKVGDRVIWDGDVPDPTLPAIVIDIISNAPGGRVQVTCRAKTPIEADDIGTAVVKALSMSMPHSANQRWVTVQDRSSYEHAKRAYRRILSLDLR